MASTAEMGVDDIRRADEMVTMTAMGSSINNMNNGHSPTYTPPTNNNNSSKTRPKFFASISPGNKRKTKPQRQHSSMFPCPLIRSVDLESPEGSVSSLGLVSTGAFASAAVTSVHARRARVAYDRRSRSVQSPTQHNSHNYLGVSPKRILPGGSAPSVQSRWPPARRVLPPRQSSLPSSAHHAVNQYHHGTTTPRLHIGQQLSCSCSSHSRLTGSGSALLCRDCQHPSNLTVAGGERTPLSISRSPLAMSIQEDDGILEDIQENGNHCNVTDELDDDAMNLRHHLQSQPTTYLTKAHRLKRQVTICEDSISIPDSMYSVRMHLPPSGALTGHRSKQNSLSIQSGMNNAANLTTGSICGKRALVTSPLSPVLPTRLPLPRQESSFTQEEIFSLQEAFAQLDLDGDGRLSRKEVEKAMGNVLSEADLNDLLADLDTDQNGEVEWQEFLHVMKNRMREPESIKMLKEAFRVMAPDSSEGGMTADQMRRCLFSEVKAACSEVELEEMLSALDLDQDGIVRMDDFVRLLATEKKSLLNNEQKSSVNCADKCVIL